MGLKSIGTDFGMSFSPIHYSKYSQKSFFDAFGYFLFFIFIGVLISFLIALPSYLAMPGQFEQALQTVEQVSFTGTLKSDGPVKIGFITLDGSGNGQLDGSGILIGSDQVQLKLPYGEWSVSPSIYTQPLLHQNTIYWQGLLLIGLFIPYIYFVWFIILCAALLVACFAAALVMSFLRGIFGLQLAFRGMLFSAMYASPALSIPSMLYLVKLPLYLNFAIPFLIYFGVLCLVFLTFEEGRKIDTQKAHAVTAEHKDAEFIPKVAVSQKKQVTKNLATKNQAEHAKAKNVVQKTTKPSTTQIFESKHQHKTSHTDHEEDVFAGSGLLK